MHKVVESKTVLMIEDDDGVRGILAIFLEKAGFQVFEAADRAAAKAIWHHQIGLIDVVVSDVLLPDGNGPEILDEFQEERPDLKVILMSGGVPAFTGEFAQANAHRKFL